MPHFNVTRLETMRDNIVCSALLRQFPPLTSGFKQAANLQRITGKLEVDNS